MSQINSQLIEKIKKLLQKTESRGATQAEAAAAFALASKLLAEHNLDLADLETDAPAEDWTEDAALDTGRWLYEHNLAYGIVKNFYFVEGFFAWTREGATKQAKKRLMLFGKKSNVETAKFVLNSLIAAFDRLWVDYRAHYNRPASERKLFAGGVAQGFADKLDRERREMEIERDVVQGRRSGSTALALVGVREQTLQAYRDAHPTFFRENGDAKGSKTTFTVRDGAADTHRAGYEAGSRLQINRGVGQERRKAIGS